MKKNDFKIDIVFLWVDGKDLNWQKEKEFWRKKLDINHTAETDNARYVENGELKYALRSIEKNAPWINKIFLITNGQIPTWLDTSNPKIKIINHKEIIPQKALPTFNSFAIEACIANIPELSEHFLLANDDCFINRPIKPSFFFNKKGYPIFRFRKKFFNVNLLKSNKYILSIYNSINLVNNRYKTNFKNIIPHHNIDAYLKSEYLNCTKEFHEEFNDIIFSKFRKSTIQRIIFSLYAIYKNKGEIKFINTFGFFKHIDSATIGINPLKEMLEKYYTSNPILLCVNDEPTANYTDRQEIKLFFEQLFQNKAPWENEQNTRIEIQKKEKYTTKILLQKILSIRNKRGHEKIYKEITFLGIKFNLKICDSQTIRKKYNLTIKKLRKKYLKKKIKICFIVRENQKWGYQSLYELFEEDPNFDPIILVCPLTSIHDNKDTTRDSLLKNFLFFKERKMNVKYLYKNNKPLNIWDFKPDIVFYDQPWDLFSKHMPQNVGKKALTCYCSYSYETLNDIDNYNKYFHPFLFAYFIEHKLNFKRYENYTITATKNCIITGYPKLDIYINEKELSDLSKFYNDKNRKKIIYAPHHSFDNSLQLATFMKNGRFILELAKKYTNTTWCFKPHPRFKFALLKMNYMTEKEIDNYFKEWEKIGKIYTEGDYFDLFKSSDLMITDCCSFLSEYLPTKKPLIRLMNPHSIPLNKLGEKIVSEYYFANNNYELENLFNQIIINGNDYKKERREKLIPEIIDFEKSASKKIYDYLIDILTTKVN